MKRYVMLAAALAAVTAGACYHSDATGLSGGTTRVFVTDDPFPYDTVARVDVYIESIALNTTADTSAAANWLTVATPNRLVNLLDFQNGKAELLDSAVVPPGEYGAVRVVINTAQSRIVSTTGAAMNIDWESSAGHPVLYAYIEHPIGIPDDGGNVVIDFDVGRSFLWYTASNQFLFSPVIRAVENGATGTVSGTLVSSEGGGLPHATLGAYASDGSQRATARTDDHGNFTIAYLVPGSYTVKFEPQPGDPDQPTEAPVTITAGQTVSGLQLVSRFCSSTQCDPCPIEGCAPNDTTSAHQCEVILNCGDTTHTDTTHTDTTHTDTTQTDTTHTDTTSTNTVARIVVSPDTAQVLVGGTQQFTATAYNAQNQVVTDASILWEIRDSAYAAVDNHGLVTGISPGTTTVFAMDGSVLGGAQLVVKKP